MNEIIYSLVRKPSNLDTADLLQLYWTPIDGYFAHSEDPDEMLHNLAFHQGLHFLHKKKMSTETHHNIEISTCDPLKYKIDSQAITYSLVLICTGKFISMKRVGIPLPL